MKKFNKNEILQWLIGFIGMIIMIALIFIAAILQGCNSGSASAKQADDLPRRVAMLQYECDKQRETIAAYENLLHRVWIDNPTYFEECLMEGDEFAVLDVIYDSEWKDVFKFRCAEDSIAYERNWDSHYVTYVIKHIVTQKPPFGGEEEGK